MVRLIKKVSSNVAKRSTEGSNLRMVVSSLCGSLTKLDLVLLIFNEMLL
jgi:hypothetical protein